MTELAKSLLKVQMEAPKLQESAVNPHFQSRYVPLEELMGQVLPLLNAHQLVLTQCPMVTETGPGLRTTIEHTEAGEALSFVTPLVTGEKVSMQAFGSAITYARRYALMSVLGLVADKDDDGQAASQTPQDEAPSEAQFRKLGAQLNDLTAKAMRDEGEPTWEDSMQEYVLRKFGKRSRKQLTKTEMSDLIDWAEKRLAEIDVPFSDANPEAGAEL